MVTKTKQPETQKIPKLRFPGFFGAWENFRIQELIDRKIIIGHLDGNHGGLYPRQDEFSLEGVPYIAANDFISGKVVFDSCKRLPIDRAKKFRKGVAKDGDVLFAHNATVGPSAVLKTQNDFVILSTTATYFRCDLERLNNFFLNSYLQSIMFVGQYRKVMSQSTRNQVPITTQRKFFIHLPNIKEQQKIAEFLKLVDEWVENLRAQKESFEAYKKGIMQKIFSQEIRFKDDKGNNFPKWEEKRLGDIADVYQPQTISQTDLTREGYDVYGANGIIGKYSKFNHEHEQIAITCRGSTCGMVNFTKPNSWITGNAMVINLDNSKVADKRFFYFLLGFSDLNYLVTGSGQPQITGDIKKHKIIMPTLKEQQNVAKFLTSIDKIIESKQQQITQAEQWKKGLMQQLFV